MKSTEIYNSTRDENGKFKTGYRASIGTKYVTIDYSTNWQRDCDKQWKVPIAEFDQALGDTTLEKILYIAQTQEPFWVGERIK